MSDSETRTLIMKPPDRTCEQGILFRLSLMTTISDALMLACARTAGNTVFSTNVLPLCAYKSNNPQYLCHRQRHRKTSVCNSLGRVCAHTLMGPEMYSGFRPMPSEPLPQCGSIA